METNRLWLLERFTERLVELRPKSVLDVGCGRGTLLRFCRTAGVRAVGVEPDPGAVDACRSEGLEVEARGAEDLGHPDGSFDWVTLRHVPHHLEDPASALAEAWRVARTGLLIAEPHYDLACGSQRISSEIDGFLKRLDRRRGMFHADVLSSEALLELLPARPPWVAIETCSLLRPYRPAEFEKEVAESSAGLELTREECDERDRFAAEVAADRVSLNGTVILTVRKLLADAERT